MIKKQLIRKILRNICNEICEGYYKDLIVAIIGASLMDWTIEDLKTLLRKNKEWKKKKSIK